MIKRFFQGLLLYLLQHPEDPDLIERDCNSMHSTDNNKEDGE